MLLLKESLDKLARFKDANAARFGISPLGLFGSVAREDNAESSDINVVVGLSNPDLRIIYGLTEILRSLYRCGVDVVRMRDSLRPSLKANIQKDAIYV